MVEGVEVLQQRVLGVDRQPVDLAAGRGPADPALLGAGQRGYVEQLGDALRPSTSQSSTLRPLRGQRAGEGAATVVLPVPPFPLTMCRVCRGLTRCLRPRCRRGSCIAG